ncbi:MAG: hypothetical protein Aureis2KO_16260 [Aureisphaera sp.]
MSSNYKIEEYKFAKEKIRKNEERRYQMIILCITAFGVVFGFSDKIPDFIIPIALLVILVITLSGYRSQSNRQVFTTAYIICFFEKEILELNYESTLRNFDKLTLDRYSNKFVSFIKNYLSMIFNPFAILFLATFFSFIFYGNNYYVENENNIDLWELIVFLIFNIIGYSYVVYNIFIMRKKGVSYYLNKLKPTANNV